MLAFRPNHTWGQLTTSVKNISNLLLFYIKNWTEQSILLLIKFKKPRIVLTVHIFISIFISALHRWKNKWILCNSFPLNTEKCSLVFSIRLYSLHEKSFFCTVQVSLVLERYNSLCIMYLFDCWIYLKFLKKIQGVFYDLWQHLPFYLLFRVML